MNKLVDILNSTKEILMSKKSPVFIKQYTKFQFKNLNYKKNSKYDSKISKIFF